MAHLANDIGYQQTFDRILNTEERETGRKFTLNDSSTAYLYRFSKDSDLGFSYQLRVRHPDGHDDSRYYNEQGKEVNSQSTKQGAPFQTPAGTAYQAIQLPAPRKGSDHPIIEQIKKLQGEPIKVTTPITTPK